MADIALSEFTVARPAIAHPWKFITEKRARELEKLVQGNALAHRHVVHLLQRRRRGGGSREQIGLHGIFDIAEVAARLAVAVDMNRLARDEFRNPPGNDCSIGAIG